MACGVQLRDEGLNAVQENLQEKTTGFTRTVASVQDFITQVQSGERSSQLENRKRRFIDPTFQKFVQLEM